jgi:hypothetical protein
MNEEDGSDTVEVQPDFELIAFDFVSNPSTHGAFMSPMNESVNRTKNPISNKEQKIHNIINDILRQE